MEALSLFCRFCERLFNNRVARYKHERRFHPEEKEANALPSSEVDSTLLIQCDVCSIFIKRDTYDLNLHKTSEHHLRRLPKQPRNEDDTAYPRFEPAEVPVLALSRAGRALASAEQAPAQAAEAQAAAAERASVQRVEAEASTAKEDEHLEQPGRAQNSFFPFDDEDDGNYQFMQGKLI